MLRRRRAPPRCPGRARARRRSRTRPAPARSATAAAAAAGCAACAAGSSRARRRTRRSGAGRRRRCRSAPGARRRSRRDRRGCDSVRSRRPSIPYMICSAAVLVGLEVGDELHELVGLPVEVEAVQRLQRERGVAHPRVAVVPVALAARRLRQRRRQRGDRRAGRHVGQALDRQRRALDRLAPAVVGDPRAGRASRARSAIVASIRALRVVDVGRRREALGPGQRAVRALARAAARAGRGPGCPRCRAPGRSAAGPSGRRRVASAACRSSSTSVHSAGVRP